MDLLTPFSLVYGLITNNSPLVISSLLGFLAGALVGEVRKRKLSDQLALKIVELEKKYIPDGPMEKAALELTHEFADSLAQATQEESK